MIYFDHENKVTSSKTNKIKVCFALIEEFSEKEVGTGMFDSLELTREIQQQSFHPATIRQLAKEVPAPFYCSIL